MTGSPVTKNPLDVYSQLEFLSDQDTASKLLGVSFQVCDYA